MCSVPVSPPLRPAPSPPPFNKRLGNKTCRAGGGGVGGGAGARVPRPPNTAPFRGGLGATGGVCGGGVIAASGGVGGWGWSVSPPAGTGLLPGSSEGAAGSLPARERKRARHVAGRGGGLAAALYVPSPLADRAGADGGGAAGPAGKK